MLRALLAAAVLLVGTPAAGAAPPVLTAAATPPEGAAPLAVTLQAGGDAVSYTWDLGDGTAAAGATVHHVYERAGRYLATVTGTRPDGETARAEVVVTAYALTLDAPRVAAFGTAVRLTGTLRPAVAGARIALERDGRGITVATADARGAFAASVRAVAPGTHTARFGEAVSPPRHLAIRPLVQASVEGPGVVGRPLRLVARVRPAGAGRLRIAVVRNGRRTQLREHAAPARVGLASGSPASFRIELRVLPAQGYAGAVRTLRTAVVDPRLGLGSRGPSVLALEQRLVELRYALPRVDGHYGLDTHQAVLAFQKVHGLPRTGRVDARVWRELRSARTPPPRHAGTHIEVSKQRQLLYVVLNGRVESIVQVSTGATGNTPVGTWRIYRKVPGWDWVLWYPMYFLRGFAVHGYPDVPPYPASHGCVRVPMWFAPRLYARFSYGQLVRIYS